MRRKTRQKQDTQAGKNIKVKNTSTHSLTLTQTHTHTHKDRCAGLECMGRKGRDLGEVDRCLIERTHLGLLFMQSLLLPPLHQTKEDEAA